MSITNFVAHLQAAKASITTYGVNHRSVGVSLEAAASEFQSDPTYTGSGGMLASFTALMDFAAQIYQEEAERQAVEALIDSLLEEYDDE
jgi:hypothetical protein